MEGFDDLQYSVLEAAFRKTLRTCKYWPIKVSDVREHVTHAEENAAGEAAEEAWTRVLDIRRRHWNPDIPGPLHRALAGLTERVRQAARAAGVFREFTAAEFENGALHTWAKKRFVESFIAYGETEQDKFLLPDGEIKALLVSVAEAKALPAPVVNFHDLHERGLQYAQQNKPLNALGQSSRVLPSWEPNKRAEIEAELQNYGERFKAAVERKRVTE